MAYKVFTNGSTLQASELNENLMQQTIAVFSNAAARTAAITSPVEGQMTYLEDVNRYDTWNSSSWVPSFGMNLIVSQTIGSAVTSITVSNAFSSTYDNYVIQVINATSSAANNGLDLTLGSTTSGYKWALNYALYANNSVQNPLQSSNSTRVAYAGATTGGTVYMNCSVSQPFLTKPTYFYAPFSDDAAGGVMSGNLLNSTSYTNFTITAGGGSLTGGTINVYGIKKA